MQRLQQVPHVLSAVPLDRGLHGHLPLLLPGKLIKEFRRLLTQAFLDELPQVEVSLAKAVAPLRGLGT
ncbi:MAG TPA: hypothetical protein VLQ93_08750, partial [Myxococcaceae bacterium]|nr:hypothetical protein [Myxococcaceae bacterium]